MVAVSPVCLSVYLRECVCDRICVCVWPGLGYVELFVFLFACRLICTETFVTLVSDGREPCVAGWLLVV